MAEERSVSTEKGEATGDKVTMALTLVHMQGPLFLYLLGALLSLAAFLGETTVALCQKGYWTIGSRMINVVTKIMRLIYKLIHGLARNFLKPPYGLGWFATIICLNENLE